MPAIPLLQTGAGILQSLIGGINARNAQRQLEKMPSPQYRPNQSILDFYNNALARYNASPQDSALYKRSQQNINRNLAGGIMGLQDRRSTLAGLPGLLRASNDAALNAEVAAEQQKDQRFGQLGSAAEAKTSEDMKAFQLNELAPYERKYNLLAQRAGENAQTVNAGLSNIFGGLQNYQNMKMLKDMYGKGGGGFYNTKYGQLYR